MGRRTRGRISWRTVNIRESWKNGSSISEIKELGSEQIFKPRLVVPESPSEFLIPGSENINYPNPEKHEKPEPQVEKYQENPEKGRVLTEDKFRFRGRKEVLKLSAPAKISPEKLCPGRDRETGVIYPAGRKIEELGRQEEKVRTQNIFYPPGQRSGEKYKSENGYRFTERRRLDGYRYPERRRAEGYNFQEGRREESHKYPSVRRGNGYHLYPGESLQGPSRISIQNKLFSEGEFTKITTPRQELLFKRPLQTKPGDTKKKDPVELTEDKKTFEGEEEKIETIVTPGIKAEDSFIAQTDPSSGGFRNYRSSSGGPRNLCLSIILTRMAPNMEAGREQAEDPLKSDLSRAKAKSVRFDTTSKDGETSAPPPPPPPQTLPGLDPDSVYVVSGPFQYYDPGQNLVTGMLMATPIPQGVTVVAVPSGQQPSQQLLQQYQQQQQQKQKQQQQHSPVQKSTEEKPRYLNPAQGSGFPPLQAPGGGQYPPQPECCDGYMEPPSTPVYPCFNNAPPPLVLDSARAPGPCLVMGGGLNNSAPRMQIPVKNTGDGCPLHRPHSGTPYMMYWDSSHPSGVSIPLRQPNPPVYYNLPEKESPIMSGTQSPTSDMTITSSCSDMSGEENTDAQEENLTQQMSYLSFNPTFNGQYSQNANEQLSNNYNGSINMAVNNQNIPTNNGQTIHTVNGHFNQSGINGMSGCQQDQYNSLGARGYYISNPESGELNSRSSISSAQNSGQPKNMPVGQPIPHMSVGNQNFVNGPSSPPVLVPAPGPGLVGLDGGMYPRVQNSHQQIYAPHHNIQMYPQQLMYPVSSGTGPLYPVPVGMSPAGPVYSTGHTPVQYSTGQTPVQYMYQPGNQNTLYEPNPTQRNTMVH